MEDKVLFRHVEVDAKVGPPGRERGSESCPSNDSNCTNRSPEVREIVHTMKDS